MIIFVCSVKKHQKGKIIPPINYKFELINFETGITLEIGAGYGSFCNLFLNMTKCNKYIIVDIQPALSI